MEGNYIFQKGLNAICEDKRTGMKQNVNSLSCLQLSLPNISLVMKLDFIYYKDYLFVILLPEFVAFFFFFF